MIMTESATADVLGFIGLVVFSNHWVIFETAFNLLSKQTYFVKDDSSVGNIDEWSVPLYFASNKYIYTQIGGRAIDEILFTWSQITSLHWNVFHPYIDRFFILLPKARFEEINTKKKFWLII